MGSNSETGHAVNISNFKLMIDTVNGFGANYAPSNLDLAVVNMTTLWTAADTAHQTLTSALQASKSLINARQLLFNPLDKLVTRTLNYFNSTKADKLIKKDAKGLADKIRGFKVKVDLLPDGTPDPNDVSQSHLSFVQRADTFKQLIDLYNSDVNYAPNEAELKIVTLTALHTNMKNANDTIGTVLAPVNNARIARNNALYTEETGVLDIAAACKDYVQGAAGFSTEEAKLVTRIRFRKPTNI